MKLPFVVIATLVAIPCAVLAQDTTAARVDTSYVDTSYVEYSEPPITLPMGIGLRVPSYDRVNGVTIPWGPQLIVADDRVQLDALVRYRSNLGNWDPSLEGFLRPGAANELKLYVGRGTFTNDSWIRSDLLNSLAALFVGSDARNYYRADRASLRFTHTISTPAITLTPFVGGNMERDWSTGSLAPQKAPWSFFGKNGNLKMKRPNPPVSKGRINSFFGGSGIAIARGGLDGNLDVTAEHAFKAPTFLCSLFPVAGPPTCDDASFTQTTLDSHVKFPTFGTQTFEFKGHAVLTSGRTTPPQRFAYLGGVGTLATVNLLALGGNKLLYFMGDYVIPIDRIMLPFVGSPFLALTYSAGTAGFGTIPPLIQNLGIGAGVSLFRVDYTIDPAQNRSPLSRKSAWSFGLSLSL